MSKIIVALDYTEQNQAKTFVDQLDASLCKVKVGKALFTTAGPGFIEYLHSKNFDVFLDLKFHDIPNTVKTACESAANLGVYMLTVHTLGGVDMLTAAMEGVDKSGNTSKPLVLGVTVLTSHTRESLQQIGINNSLNEEVCLLASLAERAKLDGVVCSAQEVVMLKEHFNDSLKLVTPGIRLSDNSSHAQHHDQKRVMTPSTAIAAGSDYLVIGRAITESDNPNQTLQEIINQIN